MATNTSVPEQLMYKNRLQTYAQRSAIPLPIYQTVNEGSPHAPRFRATVLIDGATYKSLNTFLHRKAAEQDVAKLALDCISKKLKDGGCPFIHKDTVFCKSILNEFAVKMDLTKPTYTTQQSKGLLPVFVSSLVFDGKTYTGEAGKNKKEAEQLAARTVIQSILGTSGSATLLSEIIKSKSRLYASLYKINDLGLPHGSSSGIYMGIDGVEVMGTNNLQMLGFSDVSPEQKHKKPKVEPFVETSTEPAINLTSAVGPYSFGAHSGPSSLPALVVNTSQGTNVNPNCGRKRHSKNKKRTQKKMQGDEQAVYSLESDFTSSNAALNEEKIFQDAIFGFGDYAAIKAKMQRIQVTDCNNLPCSPLNTKTPTDAFFVCPCKKRMIVTTGEIIL